MRIGVLGGTFDPIHYGHLFLAEEARTRCNLSEVVIIPAGRPPHKLNETYTPAGRRAAMVRAAIASNQRLVYSHMEIAREGPSYTVDTLAQLKQDYRGADLFYLTGIDTVAELGTWMRPDEVVRLATFVAATRPGYDTTLLERKLTPEMRDRIVVLDSMWLGISSTDIRRRVASGKAIRYLTPDSVVEYIETHSLYRGEDATENGTGERRCDKRRD